MASSPNEGQNLGSKPNARRQPDAGLLLFDLDDTIVQAGSYVSPRVIDALKAARDAGYVLSVASGRPLCSVDRTVLESGVMDYGVCANGATVVSLRDGHCLSSRLIAVADALDCHALLASYRPGWNAFFDGRAYFEWRGASYMLTGRTGAMARAARQQSQSKSRPRATWPSLARLARRGMGYVWHMVTNRSHHQVRSVVPHIRRARAGIEKMGCTIPSPDACDAAYEALVADGRFEVVRMGGTELEITARGVTKGTGARTLMDAIGVEPARAVAFGDGGNDLPLAAACGRFVAMGNADDEVKAQATEVCAPVWEDGVALWIEHELAQSAEGSGR